MTAHIVTTLPQVRQFGPETETAIPDRWQKPLREHASDGDLVEFAGCVAWHGVYEFEVAGEFVAGQFGTR